MYVYLLKAHRIVGIKHPLDVFLHLIEVAPFNQ